MMRTASTTVAALLLALALAVPASAQAERQNLGPAELIETTADEVLEVLDARREELREDTEALHAVVEDLLLPVFDVQYAGDLVLGRHAREASAEQRRRFARGLYRALMRQYGEYALDFSPQELVVRPVRGEADPRRTPVDTQVQLSDGGSVSIRYMLRETDEGWKVFDVIAEGISYIVSFREQYDGEIRRLGLDEVIARLEQVAEGEAADLPQPDLDS